jgi:hypothetical protein
MIMDWDLFVDIIALGMMLAIPITLRVLRKRPPGPGEQELSREMERFISAESQQHEHPPTPTDRSSVCHRRHPSSSPPRR